MEGIHEDRQARIEVYANFAGGVADSLSQCRAESREQGQYDQTDRDARQ